MKKQTKELVLDEAVQKTKKSKEDVNTPLLDLAKLLPSKSEKFDVGYEKTLNALQDINVAVNHEDGTWSRGSKWREYIKNQEV